MSEPSARALVLPVPSGVTSRMANRYPMKFVPGIGGYPFTRWLGLTFVGLFFAGACATPYQKPMPEQNFVRRARPEIEKFLQRVVPGSQLAPEGEAGTVELLDASLFEDGLFFETWNLSVRLGEQRTPLVLKIFPDEDSAERSRIAFENAERFGWPVPKTYFRGPVSPYQSLPGLLMEYVGGETLTAWMRRSFQDGEVAHDALEKTARSLGTLLGNLHTASATPRTDAARSGKEQLKQLLQHCRDHYWCGPMAMERFSSLAEEMDGTFMVFSHNDLYEDHIVVNGEGEVTHLIGLHSAGFADPALDAGSFLSHLLVIQRVARQAELGVPNPVDEERKRSAEAFLGAYQQACIPCREDWGGMVRRIKGYTWLRLGNLLASLGGNPHAQQMATRIYADKVGLFAADPYSLLSIYLYGADESSL